jgi:hypothetical protein
MGDIINQFALFCKYKRGLLPFEWVKMSIERGKPLLFVPDFSVIFLHIPSFMPNDYVCWVCPYTRHFCTFAHRNRLVRDEMLDPSQATSARENSACGLKHPALLRRIRRSGDYGGAKRYVPGADPLPSIPSYPLREKV